MRNPRIVRDQAWLDLITYGHAVVRITYGPDKPQHIFAGRNDFGELGMTQRNYNIDKDYLCILREERTGPQLTKEQTNAIVSNYPGGGDRAKGLIDNLQREGWLAPITVPTAHGLTIGGTYYLRDQNKYDGLFAGPIKVLCEYNDHLIATNRRSEYDSTKVWTDRNVFFYAEDLVSELPKPVEPAKPTRIPIERPVRIEAVEVGDILMYCGVKDDHSSWPVIGSEVVVTGRSYGGRGLRYSCTTKLGSKVTNQNAEGSSIKQGFSFVRRPGFAKVRDGYVKNGDTVWWLGNTGPERGVVGDPEWEARNRYNIKAYPQAYQKNEPKKTEQYEYIAKGISTSVPGDPV